MDKKILIGIIIILLVAFSFFSATRFSVIGEELNGEVSCVMPYSDSGDYICGINSKLKEGQKVTDYTMTFRSDIVVQKDYSEFYSIEPLDSKTFVETNRQSDSTWDYQTKYVNLYKISEGKFYDAIFECSTDVYLREDEDDRGSADVYLILKEYSSAYDKDYILVCNRELLGVDETCREVYPDYLVDEDDYLDYGKIAHNVGYSSLLVTDTYDYYGVSRGGSLRKTLSITSKPKSFIEDDTIYVVVARANQDDGHTATATVPICKVRTREYQNLNNKVDMYLDEDFIQTLDFTGNAEVTTKDLSSEINDYCGRNNSINITCNVPFYFKSTEGGEVILTNHNGQTEVLPLVIEDGEFVVKEKGINWFLINSVLIILFIIIYFVFIRKK